VDLERRSGERGFHEFGRETFQIGSPLFRRGDFALAFPAEAGKPADVAVGVGAAFRGVEQADDFRSREQERAGAVNFGRVGSGLQVVGGARRFSG